MKNKKGFTLIELLVSFALITIVSISLFRTVLAVQKKAQKDISYNQYIAFAATFNNAIELDFTNNTIISVAPCGQNCYDIIYSDAGTKRFSIDRNNNSVIYGTIKEKLPSYYEFAGDIKIELDTAYSAPSNTFNSVAKLIIPLKSTLLSFNQDLRYIYQYDNRVNDIAQSLYTTLTINPLGGKYDGSTENKVYNILPGQTINILTPTDKAGNVFEKWNFTGSGTYSNGVFTASTGDAVLTAGWLTYANMYTYTGVSAVVDDLNGNWRIKLYGPGSYTFTPKIDMQIEAFLVGGGGGGGTGAGQSNFGGSGGGGGYTTHAGVATLTKNTAYTIFVGDGGGSDTAGQATTAFGYSAAGGAGGVTGGVGGAGGSGGGSFGGSQSAGTYGGSDGSNGGYNSPNGGGLGQGITTREFGITSATLYAGGGGAGAFSTGAGAGGAGGGGAGADRSTSGNNGTENTGGGGGGAGALGATGGSGGSGIVVIKKSTTTYQVGNTTKFNFVYTGRLLLINQNTDNWRVKFLSNGTFTPLGSITINAFLVGGGGGGGNSGWSNFAGTGGGGGYTTNATVTLSSGSNYNIVVGAGGASTVSGQATTAFGYSAAGGAGGTSGYSYKPGAAGGSGGGAVDTQAVGKNGGSDGGNGVANGSYAGGVGQGTTTRAFADPSEELFSGGGGSGAFDSGPGTGGAGGGANGATRTLSGYSAALNTGGGGGGCGAVGTSGGTGGSGIVMIRKSV